MPRGQKKKKKKINKYLKLLIQIKCWVEVQSRSRMDLKTQELEPTVSLDIKEALTAYSIPIYCLSRNETVGWSPQSQATVTLQAKISNLISQ